MTEKIVQTIEEILPEIIKHSSEIGLSMMVGGFMGVGAPRALLEYLALRELPVLDLICSDAAFPGQGIGMLLSKSRSITGSHFGLNRDVTELAKAEKLDVHLVPQGTLVERIRAAGAGLGGVLTPTGIGTTAAEGKQVLQVGGQPYLLELPLFADVALLKAHKADVYGNLYIKKTCKNFNIVMAKAAKWVIVEVEEIVEVLDPEMIHVPHIFANQLVRLSLLQRQK